MTSGLHVALYYPAQLPVSGYGGSERVVVWLARGLVELGHRVTLLSLPGSTSDVASCVPVEPKDAFREGGADLGRHLPSDVDILHSHVPLTPPPGIPFVWTFHGTGAPGRVFPDTTIGLSASHARRHNLNQWVHNGIDPADYLFSPGGVKKPFDLFLGRLHSAKGWQWAIKGARQSGKRLLLAGGWRPSLRPGVRFLGKVGGEPKRRLLTEADCLWMPARWDEPFGLTTIEAMASGTPVLGTRRGALPEIITAESGAIADTLEEMVAIRDGLYRLEPEAIRHNVLSRFTHRHMAEGYLSRYVEAIGRG